MFLETSQNSQENTRGRASFLIKLQAPPSTLLKKRLPVSLLKKRLCHRCFPVSFAKFLRTPFDKTRLGDCSLDSTRLVFFSNNQFCKLIFKNVFSIRLHYIQYHRVFRSGSRTPATSKMGLFVIIVNGSKPLTIITKCSILNVAVALDPPLVLDSNHITKTFKIHRKATNLILTDR